MPLNLGMESRKAN